MAENSLNYVQVSGRIGTDLELSVTQNGTSVLNFRLGLNNTGDRDTEWFDVTAWEKTAEILAQYRKKGDYVLLVGKLQQDSWIDQNTGEKRYRVRIVVKENILVPGGGQRLGGGGGNPQQVRHRPPEPTAPVARRAGTLEEDDDGIPF